MGRYWKRLGVLVLLAALGSHSGCTAVSPPEIVDFFAVPESIDAAQGEASVLYWSVSDADEVTIDHGVGTVPSGGSVAVAPHARTDFTLTATNSGGTASRTITVYVEEESPPDAPSTQPVSGPDVVEETSPPDASPTQSESEPEDTSGDGVLFAVPRFDATTWVDAYEDATGWVRFQDGWLVIRNYTSTMLATGSFLEQYVEDFAVEVESKWVGGTDDNWHQIVARYDDDTASQYGFGISADGYYVIQYFPPHGETVALVGPQRSSHINTGLNDMNVMRVECIGDNLRLSVNGRFLAEATDSRLTGGDIGVGVSSFAGQYSEVAFRNLMVMAP